MDKQEGCIQFKFDEEMIPKKVSISIKLNLFILGTIQNCFYYVILVSLNDLEILFQSKSFPLVSLG